MTITTYINSSENNKLVKTITKLTEYLGCSAKAPMSTIDPKIIIVDSAFNVNCNYIYIADLERYYFVKNITTLNNGSWELDCHIDVLMSYADEIKQQTVTFKRQEYLYNMYIKDPEFMLQSKNDVVTKQFPVKDGFKLSTNSFILTVAN